MNRWLQRIWYRSASPPLVLRPLAGLYGAVADNRGRRQRAGARSLPVPVVVVGNVAVGGTGKTPCVLWLVELLRQQGRRPGILSRGYGGRGPFPMSIETTTSAAVAGDEPLLLARRSQVPVAVAPDRVAAGRFLLQTHPEVDVLVCDDGLQHYRLARDLEFCVIDGARGYGNGWRLPAGPLREPPARAGRCDLLLVNGADAGAYGDRAVRFDLDVDQAINLADGRRRPLAVFVGEPVHAVAGIGAPQRFFDTLGAHGLQLVPHAFPDHYPYRLEDLRFADSRPVLMTEKDAVKCLDFGDPRLWAVPAQLRPSAAASSHVRELLQGLSSPAA